MKISLKISYVILTILILFIILSNSVNAASKAIEIIKSGDDYIIYIEGYDMTKFKFAFSNSQTADISTLKFKANWTDTEGNNVACLDNEMGIDLNSDIYIWIKDENGNVIIPGEKLDLSSTLNLEETQKIIDLTNRIKVDLTQSDTQTDEVDGIKKTVTVGKMIITDDNTKTYKYSLINLTSNSEAQELINLFKKSSNSSIGMTEKISLWKKIGPMYNNLFSNADLKNVENMTIKQPAEAKDGDKYIVLLEQIANKEIVNRDIQVLNCFQEIIEEKVTEKIPVKVYSALPVTGDYLVLYIAFGIVLVLTIVVSIRLATLKSKGKNEE